MNIRYLNSADHTPWKESLAKSDNLPIRESGPWIDTKHKLLAYYADIFASAMKRKFESRVYLELFSGPGRCLLRETGAEEPGSPIRIIGHDFTRFIFTEINAQAAQALAARLEPHANSRLAEIWCGDCAEVIRELAIPPEALTFAFIDPTGIGHAPISIIKALHQLPHCDLLITVHYGGGIKRNIHQYTSDVDEQSALTKFLGNESWKSLSPHNKGEFARGVLRLYKAQLETLGFRFVGEEVLIRNTKNVPLYLLLYASRHQLGKKFWTEAIKGVREPEFNFGG